MAQTIVALFDRREDAEQALGALMESGLAGHRSAIVRGEAHSTEMAPFRDPSTPQAGAPGGLASYRLPNEDRASLEAALGRGASVLVADIVGDVDRAIAIVDTFSPADLDDRTQERQRAAAGGDAGDRLGAGLTAGMGAGLSNAAAVPGMAGMAESTHDVGAADLRTPDLAKHDLGQSTRATGAMRGEERADAPGALELGVRSQAPTPGLGSGTASGTLRRETTRSGRVRSYIG